MAIEINKATLGGHSRADDQNKGVNNGQRGRVLIQGRMQKMVEDEEQTARRLKAQT
jgi:hypothetical protein